MVGARARARARAREREREREREAVPFQIQFHKAVGAGSLPHILGKETVYGNVDV